MSRQHEHTLISISIFRTLLSLPLLTFTFLTWALSLTPHMLSQHFISDNDPCCIPGITTSPYITFFAFSIPIYHEVPPILTPSSSLYFASSLVPISTISIAPKTLSPPDFPISFHFESTETLFHSKHRRRIFPSPFYRYFSCHSVRNLVAFYRC